MSALDAEVHAQLLRDALPRPAGAPRIQELVRQADPLLGSADVARVAAGVSARLRGLGALEAVVADPEVTDVMVNGPGPVWVERAGRLEATPLVLRREEIELVIQQIVAPLGLRVDPASPVVDARLPDGSRVHVVVPPLAVDGPCLTIRRFGAREVDVDHMAAPPVAALLRWAVRARANVVVSGGTGSGKTTLLNALGRELPETERVVTVEDAAELRLPSRHVVRLEARPASAEGRPGIGCRDLVRGALRMRPDRLVIGEVRGGEAFDLLQAMNTGHDGCLSTVHANSAEDAVARLEALVLLAGVGLGLADVRAHLVTAVDLVVHVARTDHGRRRVVEVAEVGTDPRGSGGAGGRATVLVADELGIHRPPSRPSRRVAAGAPPPPGQEPPPCTA